MKYPAYPSYKASSVEWLGDVPEHWEVKRLRHVLVRNDGGVWGDEDDPEGTIILRSTEQTLDGGWKINDPAQRLLSESEKRDCVLKAGDLVVTKSSGSAQHIGKTSLVDDKVASLAPCFSNFMQRLRFSRLIDPRLGFYLLNSPTGRQQLVFYSNTTTGLANLNGSVLGDVFFGLPPFEEQRSIADFLDRQTVTLDALIAKKRLLIERLKAKRTALISRTVTRGLPPAAACAAGFDPQPNMKDSGIEWLGEIPKHWQPVPFGYLVRFRGGATPDKSKTEYWDGEIPWVSPKDMKLPKISDSEDHVSEEALKNSPLSIIPVEAILIVVRGMILAHSFPVALTTAEVTINQDMKALICGNRITPNFLFWSFTGFKNAFVSLADESSHGTRKLETNTLLRFPLLVPPFDEQKAIAAYLDDKTAKLDALAAKVEQAIKRLQDYRSALITAAVTGKIDVRGAHTSSSPRAASFRHGLPESRLHG